MAVELADLPDIAPRLSASLSRRGIPHALTGSLALAAHGVVRATRDIDLLVVVPSIRLTEVFACIREFGFAGDDAALIASFRERAVATLTSGPASVEVLAPVLPFHHEVLRRATLFRLGGVDVPVVELEDLIVLKATWMRDKDRADLRALFAARRAGPDASRARARLAALLPEGHPRLAEFDELVTAAAAGRDG